MFSRSISATADNTEIISLPASLEESMPSSTHTRLTPKSCMTCKVDNTSAALRPKPGELEHQHIGNTILARFDVIHHFAEGSTAFNGFARFAGILIFADDLVVVEVCIGFHTSLLCIQRIAIDLHRERQFPFYPPPKHLRIFQSCFSFHSSSIDILPAVSDKKAFGIRFKV